jgi:DNA-binding transcriptional MerR regulator
MTIQELADRAEVTTRTIRYYVEQGVLPPPERGRPAEYTEEHLERLALIKRLKEQYLPLEEIRDTMRRLTIDEVEQLVEQHSPPTQEVVQQQKLESAAEYIAGVLSRGAAREQLKQQAEPPVGGGRWTLKEEGLAHVPPAGQAVAPGAPPAAAKKQSLIASRPSAEGATAAYAPSSISSPAPMQAEQAPAGVQASTWERIDLGEGVELHYPAQADARTREKVARLIEAARRILGKDPENGE